MTIYAWEVADQCPDCEDHPTGICRTCKDNLESSEAERWAEGRREGDE